MAFFGGIPGMLKGAGVGAGLGYLGADGDYLRAMGGGAIGGALMGGFGAVGMRKLAGGRTIAGMAQTGLGYGIRGLGITGGALAGGGRFSRGMANIAGLGIGGMFIITAEPVVLAESLSLEFLLPGSLNPIQLEGESVWSRSCSDTMGVDNPPHVAGIKFINVTERFRHILQDYILEMLSRKSPVVTEGFSS